jgi:hypothetical protein
MGEVEPLINLQLLHDDTHEIIKQIHLFTALGRLIVDEGTGLNEDSMGNEPGEIWWVKPGTSDRVKWLQGSSPPAELYTYLSTLERSADLVTGSFDVTRGINPTGVTAGRALATLQNAANIRIRARLNDVEGALVQTGRHLAALVQQFWPDELSMEVAGEQTVSRLSEDARTFKQFQISPHDREATYNLEVSATANIAQLKEQEFQKLLLLFQAGLITPEALIEGSNLTNKEKILTELPLIAAHALAVIVTCSLWAVFGPEGAADIGTTNRKLEGSYFVSIHADSFTQDSTRMIMFPDKSLDINRFVTTSDSAQRVTYVHFEFSRECTLTIYSPACPGSPCVLPLGQGGLSPAGTIPATPIDSILVTGTGTDVVPGTHWTIIGYE